MKQLGSTIECYRGESFIIRRSFVGEDGEPLYITPDATNPFIRFTISSNTFKIDGQYKKNYWLDLSACSRFNGYEQFADNEIPEDVSELSESLIYYLITENGREYYIKVQDNMIRYEFMIQKRFLNSDTKKWVGQTYQYEIAFCTGELVIDWLQKTFKSLYPGVVPPNDKSTLVHYICKKRSDLLRGLRIDEPFVNYRTNVILQGPSKLIVKEN